MIISFNQNIFKIKEDSINYSIAEIFIELAKNDLHFLDTKEIDSLIFDSTTKYIFNATDIAKKYFSANQKIIFEFYITQLKKVPITKVHYKHLTQIKIGVEVGEVHPVDALKVVKERSKVIIENSINDWKFIVGVCHKYTSHKSRSTIYKLINKAIDKEYLEPDSGGGVGEIKKQCKKWIASERYKNIYLFKLMALFDSDKKSKTDNTDYLHLLSFFKGKTIDVPTKSDYEYDKTDNIIWHILYKRRLENYLPLHVIKSKLNLTSDQIKNLDLIIPDDWDFMEFDTSNVGISSSKIKEVFPNLFLENYSYSELEKLCGHHTVFSTEANENISEYEQILLKIAKII